MWEAVFAGSMFLSGFSFLAAKFAKGKDKENLLKLGRISLGVGAASGAGAFSTAASNAEIAALNIPEGVATSGSSAGWSSLGSAITNPIDSMGAAANGQSLAGYQAGQLEAANLENARIAGLPEAQRNAITLQQLQNSNMKAGLITGAASGGMQYLGARRQAEAMDDQTKLAEEKDRLDRQEREDRRKRLNANWNIDPATFGIIRRNQVGA